MRKLFAVLLPATTVLTLANPVDASDMNFVAHLSVRDEVPSNESLATGQAIFHLSADGTQLGFKLIAANIENVVAAHIHLGPEGVNGPVVAFLFGPAAAGGGRSDGVLAEGTITEADLVGPWRVSHSRRSSMRCRSEHILGVVVSHRSIDDILDGSAWDQATTRPAWQLGQDAFVEELVDESL